MALTTPQLNMVSNADNVAHKLMDLYGLLVELDALWAGTPAYNAMSEADLLAAFPGLGTKQRLSDGMAALAIIKTDITNALPALSVMASI